MSTWDPSEEGVLTLPSGLRVRGRGLRRPTPEGPEPDAGLYLLGSPPDPLPWPSRWVRWPDFRTPSDPADAEDALREVLHRAADQRVEVACEGGRGRTGTALACLAVLDGVPAREAVAYVRRGYHPRAVETPGQWLFVRRFARRLG